MTKRSCFYLLAAAFVAIAAGCGGSTISLTGVAISPATVSLEVGKTQQLTLSATFSDASTANPDTGVTWAASDPTIATVSASGLVTAVKVGGPVTITGSYSGKSATSAVTVPATLTSIAIGQASPVALTVGGHATLSVTGTYNDASAKALTSGVTFAVTAAAPAGAATVDPASGVLTGVKGGTATVTATASGKTATVNVAITATLTSIAIDQTSPIALFVSQTKTLTVTGTYNDSTTKALTSGVTFAVTASTPSTGVASVGATSGVVTAVGAGTATVTATNASPALTANVTVNVAVGAPTLTSITVAPNPIVLVKGTGTATLTVTGHYSDSSSAVIANSNESFVSNSSAVASVGATGLVTAGASPGTTTIVVTDKTTTSVTLTVPVQVYDAASANVFVGDYDPGVNPLAGFGGSFTATHALTRDATTTNNGHASLKMAVDASCSSYIGGYIAAAALRDLHAYNAITFWAKTDVAAGVNVAHVGFGNDNTATGTNGFNVESHGPAGTGFALTTNFTQYYIPIPNPAALTAVDGLFYFSSGCTAAGNIWFNDIQFVTLSAAQLTSNFGALTGASSGAPPTLSVVVGTPALISDPGPNTINYASANVYIVGWAYFTYASADATVVTVDGNGNLVGHKAGGPTNVTLTFPGTSLSKVIAVTVTVPLAVPTTLATTPTIAAANVISMFNSSGTYTNHAIDTWQTSWSTGGNEYTQPVIAGKTVKKYTLHSFVGVEFLGANNIDVSTMGFFHVDVWSPNPPARMEIQLVNNVGPSQVVARYEATPIASGSWVSFDVPLSSFSPSVAGDTQLGQMLFIAQDAGGGNVNSTIYVDNIYFHK